MSTGPMVRDFLVFFRTLGASRFIETGTYYADTTLTASPIFNRVVTIEADEALASKALDRVREEKNIRLVCGHSGTVLERVIHEERSQDWSARTLYWLDAHWWAGTKSWGVHDQCPLMNELAAINKLDPEAFIMIDDANFFADAPPEPYNSEQWPTLRGILLALHKKQRMVMIHQNIILAVPVKFGEEMKRWVLHRNPETKAIPALEPV